MAWVKRVSAKHVLHAESLIERVDAVDIWQQHRPSCTFPFPSLSPFRSFIRYIGAGMTGQRGEECIIGYRALRYLSRPGQLGFSNMSAVPQILGSDLAAAMYQERGVKCGAADVTPAFRVGSDAV